MRSSNAESECQGRWSNSVDDDSLEVSVERDEFVVGTCASNSTQSIA